VAEDGRQNARPEAFLKTGLAGREGLQRVRRRGAPRERRPELGEVVDVGAALRRRALSALRDKGGELGAPARREGAVDRAHRGKSTPPDGELLQATLGRQYSPPARFAAQGRRMRYRPLSGIKLTDMVLKSWTIVILIFLYLPILLLVIYSFNNSKLNIVWEGFTFKWYQQLWGEIVAHLGDERRSPLVESLNNSLIIAGFTTIFSVILGTAGAWLLYRFRYPALRSISTLIFLPMIIPEIIMGISLLIFFKTIDLELGFTTVIISHVTFCFPFVLIAVQARLAGVDPALEEAAMDLGATPLKAFFLIMVPYLLPAIISGALMSFTLSLDELIVTYFTRGPKSETLPIKVFGMAKVGLNPILNTISTVFIVLTAMLVVTAESLKKVNR
jgi:spermidine/putrescine transport system permease protein